MARLKAAAGPGVRIVGMNYYLPALAEWRDGLPGHLVAWAAERLAATYNDLLDRVYTTSGARVANVFGAFDTADFAVQGHRRRAMSPCCASGPGRAPLRPAGPTSTPTRPAIRSSPACSCKPPGCTEFPGRNASLDTATPATEAGNCDSGRTLICGGPAWAQARPSASFPAER